MNIDDLIKLAETYAENGNLSQALSHCDQAINKDPTDDYIYFIRGRINYLFDKYLEAINDFNKSIEIFPDGTADLYAKRNKSAKALLEQGFFLCNQTLCDYFLSRVFNCINSFINCFFNRVTCRWSQSFQLTLKRFLSLKQMCSLLFISIL